MFGFGNKKRFAEFVEDLSSLGNISTERAREFVDENEQEIKAAFSRGLKPFDATIYLAEKQMERIYVAHAVNELHRIEKIEDYWLLVCLQAINAFSGAGVPSEQIDSNFKFWNRVVEISVENVEVYGEKLKVLVQELNAGKKY